MPTDWSVISSSNRFLILKSKLYDRNNIKEKENIIPPVKERVAGEWKMAYYADDDNNNQKLDENEKYDADDDETNTIIFMGDGSGMTRSVYTDFNVTTLSSFYKFRPYSHQPSSVPSHWS